MNSLTVLEIHFMKTSTLGSPYLHYLRWKWGKRGALGQKLSE